MKAFSLVLAAIFLSFGVIISMKLQFQHPTLNTIGLWIYHTKEVAISVGLALLGMLCLGFGVKD